MNNGILSLIFLVEVVYHQSLEGLGSIGLDFFLNNLNKIDIELVFKDARAVAASAWQSLFVELRPITFETNESFFIGDLLLLLFRAKNLAINFLGNRFNSELVALGFGLD